MIGRLWSLFLERKRRRYFSTLCSRGMKIGDDVTIEDGFFFDPSHCYLIEIGARCTLAPNVRLVAHDASTKRLLGATRLGRIVIEEECFIGDSVIILPGVTVGRGSILGAGSVVTRSVPAGSVAAGNPARVLGSADDYRRKQAERLAAGKKFSADYWVGAATPAQLKELSAAVASGIVFIE
jgi:maltose O-acetyltransferase